MEKNKDMLNYSCKGCMLNFVILTIAIIILSRIVMYLVYKMGYNHFHGSTNFINAINIWDSGWYRGIIENGYNLHPYDNIIGNPANWAFFPLYPFIVKAIHYIFPIDISLLGSIVSTLFFLFALIVSYVYIIETRKNKKQGLFFILMMSFGMYSFYFSILYTESLYLFLLVLALYFLHKDKYILVGFIGALLSATRNMGVMIVFGVLVQYTATYLKSKDKSVKGYIVSILKDPNLILGILLIPLGLFTYMAYLGRLIGDPLAFAHIQIAWDRTISNPIIQIMNGLLSGDKYSFYLAVWALFGILCVIWLAIEKRWIEFTLAFLFIIVPLTAGLQSIPRFIMGSFVYMLSFSDIINKLNKQWLWIIVIILSSLGEILMLFKWFEGNSFILC